ncbi:hypothetical protein K438DRAFT_1879721 [Mycena galopus ATCC 62051]|nr:hypothetical protein K438DRAFT_1879721 [Mycena galopus ATCC 62051]
MFDIGLTACCSALLLLAMQIARYQAMKRYSTETRRPHHCLQRQFGRLIICLDWKVKQWVNGLLCLNSLTKGSMYKWLVSRLFADHQPLCWPWKGSSGDC